MTCRGWVLGTVLDGVAPQEKEDFLFFLARENLGALKGRD